MFTAAGQTTAGSTSFRGRGGDREKRLGDRRCYIAARRFQIQILAGTFVCVEGLHVFSHACTVFLSTCIKLVADSKVLLGINVPLWACSQLVTCPGSTDAFYPKTAETNG